MSDLDKQLMNADSFDELYLAYYPAMLSYARMFLRDQWAEDVVQDVFFNIWKLPPDFHGRSVVQVPAEGCLQLGDQLHLEAQARHGVLLVVRFADRPDGVRLLRSGQESDPCQKIYDNDAAAAAAGGGRGAARCLREIFRMRFFENMSNKEIGERLG